MKNVIRKEENNNIVDELSRTFLNSTLKEIMSSINAECGSFFLLDSKNKELVMSSFSNSVNLDLKGLRQKIGEGIAGTVAATQSPILVKDISSDSRFRRNGFNHYHTNSFISLPLVSSRGPLGVINLADKSSGEPFSEKDLELAVAIAKYFCLIIDNLDSCMGSTTQEKETLNRQKMALEKYASMGKLAAGVVHEINNPLDGVTRYTNILLEQLQDNSIAREYLLEVKKGLSRIANITRSLLEFSHYFNPSQIKSYVDLHRLIDESLDSLRAKINGNIKVSKEYTEHLPRIADIGIQHAIVNMLKNALDAMPCGGTLCVSTEMNDSMVKITFKDTGVGIPSEILDHIFEPFFTTKSIDKGSGLGLSICKEIINKYEGDIEVQSFPGQGSNFTISIPDKYLENA